MKILSLNCQKAYNPGLRAFLRAQFESGEYDFIALQEANDEVIGMFRDIGGYKLVTAFNEEAGTQSHVCIAYRDRFRLKDTFFRSFSNMNRKFFRRAELGFMIVEFDSDEGPVMIGSIHLHPASSAALRTREVRIVKQEMLARAKKGVRIAFAGDFNLSLPGERGRTRRILAPEFVDATKDSGPTLNSRYSEPGTHMANRIGFLLAKLGIAIYLTTDRAFVDRDTAASSDVSVRILPDHVSDHSPVELSISAKSAA